jgi:hypothetical protein
MQNITFDYSDESDSDEDMQRNAKQSMSNVTHDDMQGMKHSEAYGATIKKNNISEDAQKLIKKYKDRKQLELRRAKVVTAIRKTDKLINELYKDSTKKPKNASFLVKENVTLKTKDYPDNQGNTNKGIEYEITFSQRHYNTYEPELSKDQQTRFEHSYITALKRFKNYCLRIKETMKSQKEYTDLRHFNYMSRLLAYAHATTCQTQTETKRSLTDFEKKYFSDKYKPKNKK